MKHRIITISRQFGSGGRTIGKLTAEKLGIPCYDQELIDQIAQESGFPQEFVKERGEYAANSMINAFLGRTGGPTPQDKLWVYQKKLITELAEKEPCVIVGRCADYILRERGDCLRVFIHAELDKRAERIVHVYGEREEAPAQRLAQKDKQRAAYYQYYTDMQWGDARNYHITLDSGELGIDQCVELLAQIS